MERENKAKGRVVDGRKLKIAVVVSRFHDDLTGKMLEGAVETLRASGVKDEKIKVVWVPGSFEIPLACQRLAATKKFDGIVAIGCVIRGETDHHIHVGGEASSGIMKVMLDYSIPIGFGIITANNLDQAIARAYGKGNKGVEATEAVLEMIDVFN